MVREGCLSHGMFAEETHERKAPMGHESSNRRKYGNGDLCRFVQRSIETQNKVVKSDVKHGVWSAGQEWNDGNGRTAMHRPFPPSRIRCSGNDTPWAQ